MESFDIAGGLKNLLPGSLDTLRGPYATLAAANTAIPNNIVSGESYRKGKKVDIGTVAPYVEHVWGGDYSDGTLVPSAKPQNDAIALKAPILNPQFSGDVLAPTRPVADITSYVATTLFTQNYLNSRIAAGLSKSTPGNIDSLRGPYASVAAANTAVPNTMVSGKSLREGKFVEIGSAGVYKTYWWSGTDYADDKLVEYVDLHKADIVNDLASGGIAKILSAEQGKILNEGLLNIRGEKTYLFPGANLVTTVYDYNGSTSPAVAAAGENPVQTIVTGQLQIVFKHGSTDLAFLNTGLVAANTSDYNYLKLRFTPSNLTNSPSIGLVIGDAAVYDWLALLYNPAGGVFGLNAIGSVVTLRANNASYVYTTGDAITVEYDTNTGIARTSKNGVYSPDIVVGSRTGKVYIGARGANAATIKADLINTSTPDGFGRNLSDRVTTLNTYTSKSFGGIPLKPYTFTGFNVANITGYSSTGLSTTYALSDDGLDLNYAAGSTATAFYKGLGFDNSKPVYSMSLRWKIISLGTNPIIGAGFGVYGTNLHCFGYRQDGSLSFNINNTITNPRAATPALAYVVGDTIGLDFTVNKTAGTVTIKTVLNNVVNDVEWVINPVDFTDIYLYLRSPSRTQISGLINQLSASSASSASRATVYYVNGTTGSDTNNGSSGLPFKTLAKAVSSVVGLALGKIIVAGGVYRETLNLSALTYENIEIYAQSPDVVQIFGSDQITGWTKTSGQTYVYEATFAGTIIDQSRAGALIFENGNPSRLISSSDRSALQKGLGYRLPFTEMKPVASIALVNSTAGSYFVTGGKIYIRSASSSDPSTNGFTYENIVRAGASSPGFNVIRKADVTLRNLQFLYHTGARFAGFGIIRRFMCTSLASSGSGALIDDNNFSVGYKDESGFCDGDGTNGHYSSVSGYETKDQREGVMNGWYTDSWCHDNFDDGLSFHERADITLSGGYFEFNGDGGVRQSNDANFRIYAAAARNNGWDPTAGTRGTGFDMVNGPSTNRLPGSMYLHACLSENNRNGIGVITGGGTLHAFNCVTRNNTDAEFLAETGVINAYNCRATNADPLKIKVVTSGTINVFTDSLLS